MSATFSCKRCKPNVLECDICKSVKPNDEFPRQKYRGNVCKRCKSCFKCHFCEQTFTCATSLVAHHRPTICNRCSPHEHCTCDDCVHKIKNRPILCNMPKCDNYIDRKHVPDEVWRHAVEDKRRLICKECKNKGYDLTDTNEYQCNSEKKCVWGHLNFPKTHFNHWKMGRTSKLLCKYCEGVDASTETKVDDASTKTRARRTYASATPMLTCHLHSERGSLLPREEFSRQTLKNQAGQNFHACSECERKLVNLRELFKTRKSKYVCTCKYQDHKHADDRCPLFQHKVHKHWPGSDFRGRDHVNEDQVEFLDRLPKHSKYAWWHKQWGRSYTKNTKKD